MSAIAQLAPPTRPVCDDHPLAQVHQLLLFQRPGPVLVFWIKSPPFIGTSLVLKTGETLIDHLVGTDDNGGGVVDRFIDEINDAIRAGKPASIIAIKDRVLEKTIGYFEQTCVSRRPAHVVLALTLLVDFIRSIDQITEAVLSSSRKEIAVRLSTATAGPRYRNDAPRATPLAGADEAGVKAEKPRRLLPFRNSSHPAPDALAITADDTGRDRLRRGVGSGRHGPAPATTATPPYAPGGGSRKLPIAASLTKGRAGSERVAEPIPPDECRGVPAIQTTCRSILFNWIRRTRESRTALGTSRMRRTIAIEPGRDPVIGKPAQGQSPRKRRA